MALLVENYETKQGFIIPLAYYRIDHIDWYIPNNSVLYNLNLYASKEAAEAGRPPLETESVSNIFILDGEPFGLKSICYNNIMGIINAYNSIESAIAAYEEDDNNYIIEYDENDIEIARHLIPNDELYSQRFELPAGFEKLLNAVSDQDPHEPQ